MSIVIYLSNVVKMKNLIKTGFVFSVLFLAGCNKIEPATDYDGTFIDPRDSTEYKYVNIGTQTWMAENMRYRMTDPGGTWCFDSDEANCRLFGRLYNYQSAKKACPPGWHLPTDAEWKKLEVFAGMEASDADSVGWRNTGSVGIALKATKGWNSGGTGENVFRFSAIPSGIVENGAYDFIGDITTFWSSTDSDETHAWGRGLVYYEAGVYRWKYTQSSGFSVRCLKD
jgi:uncharacterized protein (TIGR02145 family)